MELNDFGLIVRFLVTHLSQCTLITGFSDRGMPAHPGVGLLRPPGEAGERAAARPARRRGGRVRRLRRTHRQERSEVNY